MDSITQIVLGAATGEAVLGKKIGNKAMLWGAILGTVPDLDVIPGWFLDTVTKLTIHRGFSHSILFCVLMAPVFAWLLQKLYKKDSPTFKQWTLFSFWCLFTHPILDAFTTWGTSLFYPFSNYRVAIKSVFVIDPLYTVPFLICCIWVLFLKRSNPKRQIINWIGIGVSSTYLIFTLANKLYINSVFEKALRTQNIDFKRFDSRPTPINNILWTANIETNESYLIGFYSHLNSTKHIEFSSVTKNHKLLTPYFTNKDVKNLVFMSEGYYTIEKHPLGLEMNDLRFGQMENFESGEKDFVFSYILVIENDQIVRVDENRKTFKDGKKTMQQLWERIKGNKL